VVVAAAAATTAVAAAASPAAAGVNYEGCSTVIVGAGIGGAYTAWRLAVDDGGRKAAGRSICVFEAAARPGGRILTFRDAPSPFDGSAVDLGAYRFHRGEHAMVRSVAEGRLGLVTHCYSDPLGDTLRGMAAGVNGTADHVTRRVAVCPPQTRPVTVARGVRFAAAPGAAFSRADPVRDGVEGVAYNPSLPWVIPPPGRWGPNAALRAPRSAFGLLMGPGSPIPEVAKNFLRLVRAPTYDAAMVVADDIVGKLRGAAYKGIKLHEVTVYQVAQAEGMSPEELALSQDTNVGIGVFSQMTVADFLADALRGIALGKGDFDGPRDYVTPVAADASGAGVRRIGMGSIVEGLLDAAKGAGVRVFYTTRLTGVRRAGTGVRLSFANGASVEARRSFLNMGKPDVAALGGTSLPTAGATRPFTRAFGAHVVEGRPRVRRPHHPPKCGGEARHLCHYGGGQDERNGKNVVVPRRRGVGEQGCHRGVQRCADRHRPDVLPPLVAASNDAPHFPPAHEQRRRPRRVDAPQLVRQECIGRINHFAPVRAVRQPQQRACRGPRGRPQ